PERAACSGVDQARSCIDRASARDSTLGRAEETSLYRAPPTASETGAPRPIGPWSYAALPRGMAAACAMRPRSHRPAPGRLLSSAIGECVVAIRTCVTVSTPWRSGRRWAPWESRPSDEVAVPVDDDAELVAERLGVLLIDDGRAEAEPHPLPHAPEEGHGRKGRAIVDGEIVLGLVGALLSRRGHVDVPAPHEVAVGAQAG